MRSGCVQGHLGDCVFGPFGIRLGSFGMCLGQDAFKMCLTCVFGSVLEPCPTRFKVPGCRDLALNPKLIQNGSKSALFHGKVGNEVLAFGFAVKAWGPGEAVFQMRVPQVYLKCRVSDAYVCVCGPPVYQGNILIMQGHQGHLTGLVQRSSSQDARI